MNRGYIHFWRKTWFNRVLQERAKRFSRMEAWLWIVSMEARGVDDPEPGGLKRGEFEASLRHLARTWRWGLAAVHRFMADLRADGMIEKVERWPRWPLENPPLVARSKSSGRQ